MTQTTADAAGFVKTLGTAQDLTNKILAALGVDMWVGVASRASEDYPTWAISLSLWNSVQHALVAVERQMCGEDYDLMAQVHVPLLAASSGLNTVHHYAVEGGARPGAQKMAQDQLDRLADVIGLLYLS